MSSLKEVFCKGAIVSTVTLRVSGILSAQEDFITSADISKRTQYYNLNQSDEETLALFRNPAHRSPSPVRYDDAGNVKDSVGWFDMRRPVSHLSLIHI